MFLQTRTQTSWLASWAASLPSMRSETLYTRLEWALTSFVKASTSRLGGARPAPDPLPCSPEGSLRRCFFEDRRWRRLIGSRTPYLAHGRGPGDKPAWVAIISSPAGDPRTHSRGFVLTGP